MHALSQRKRMRFNQWHTHSRLCRFSSPSHVVFLIKCPTARSSGRSERPRKGGSAGVLVRSHQVFSQLVELALSREAPLEMLLQFRSLAQCSLFSFHATRKPGNIAEASANWQGRSARARLSLMAVSHCLWPKNNRNVKFKMADTWRAMHLRTDGKP